MIPRMRNRMRIFFKTFWNFKAFWCWRVIWKTTVELQQLRFQWHINFLLKCDPHKKNYKIKKNINSSGTVPVTRKTDWVEKWKLPNTTEKKQKSNTFIVFHNYPIWPYPHTITLYKRKNVYSTKALTIDKGICLVWRPIIYHIRINFQIKYKHFRFEVIPQANRSVLEWERETLVVRKHKMTRYESVIKLIRDVSQKTF